MHQTPDMIMIKDPEAGSKSATLSPLFSLFYRDKQQGQRVAETSRRLTKSPFAFRGRFAPNPSEDAMDVASSFAHALFKADLLNSNYFSPSGRCLNSTFYGSARVSMGSRCRPPSPLRNTAS